MAFGIPPLVWYLVADTAGVALGLGKARGEMATTAEESKTFGGVSSGAFMAAGAAAAGAAVHFVHSAGDFNSGIVTLKTGAGETQQNLALVSNGILDLAGQVGDSTKELTDGMYHVESAGFHGADGLNVLANAAKGAKVGNADLDAVAKTVVGTMDSYGEAGSQAASMVNRLVAATAAGDMRMNDLATSLGAVAPKAAAAGVSIDELLGATATMTRQNVSAQQGVQNLANLIGNIQKPSAQAAKEMSAMGLDAQDVAAKLGQRGLTGTLDLLTSAITEHMGPSGLVLQNAFNQSKSAAADANEMIKNLPASVQNAARQYLAGTLNAKQWSDATKDLSATQAAQARQFATVAKNADGFNSVLRAGGPAAQTYQAALATMTGGSTGLNTALMLTGSNAAVFKANVQSISDAAKNGGNQINGWADVQKTFNQRMAEAKGTTEALGIRIGNMLLPAFQSILTVTMSVVDWFGRHKTIAELLGFAVLTLVAGFALYKTGVMAAAVATAAMEGAEAALNLVMDANPILLVVGALAALAAGLVWAYDHVKWFHDFVDTAFHAIGQLAGWLKDQVLRPFTDLWQTVQDIWHLMGDFLTGHWSKLWGDLKKLAVDGLKSMGDSMFGFFSGLPGKFLDWTKDLGGWIVKGLTSGLGALGSQLWNWVYNWAKDNIVGSIEDLFGISSPSRLMHEYGGHIGQGLINGIVAKSSGVKDAAGTMAAAVSAGMAGLNMPALPDAALAGAQLPGAGTLALTAAATTTAATGNASSGGPSAPTVVVNVGGSVLSENDLADVVEKVFLQQGARYSSSYTPFHR